MRKVRFTIGDARFEAELLDTPTAEKVWQALPITAPVNTWGDEVYFTAGVAPDEEPDARELMQDGEIAYWPGGDAIAIAFGETPISAPGEMRLVSPCNVWARTDANLGMLGKVHAGATATVEAVA